MFGVFNPTNIKIKIKIKIKMDTSKPPDTTTTSDVLGGILDELLEVGVKTLEESAVWAYLISIQVNMGTGRDL